MRGQIRSKRNLKLQFGLINRVRLFKHFSLLADVILERSNLGLRGRTVHSPQAECHACVTSRDTRTQCTSLSLCFGKQFVCLLPVTLVDCHCYRRGAIDDIEAASARCFSFCQQSRRFFEFALGSFGACVISILEMRSLLCRRGERLYRIFVLTSFGV